MTKKEFLKDPSGSILRSGGPFPVDWMTSAWQDAQFKQNVTLAVTRSVCKNGDFVVADFWLRTLPEFFSATDTIELYEYIRDQSGRSEEEWRAGFERAFFGHASALPPAQA